VLKAFLEQPMAGTHRQQLERFLYLARRLLACRSGLQRTKNDAFVHTVDAYIRAHLGEELSLVTLSETVYLNPSYLSRRYKELTGRNISDVITEERIRKATQLLLDDAWKIHDISEAIGYVSPAYFTRVFKKQTGVTPQEWRDNRKNLRG